MNTLHDDRDDFQAIRWWKNGDHPDDNSEYIHGKNGERFLSEGHVVRYYRHPDVDGESVCPHCSNIMHYHGFIDTGGDGSVVCPGDWVVNHDKGEYRVLDCHEFKEFIRQY